MKRLANTYDRTLEALLGASLGMASILSSATMAAAQQAATAPDSSRVEEVVVTAEKRSESVQRIPSTISALSTADIKTRGIESIDDISRMVPSVNFGKFGYSTQISARGVGMNLIAGEGESSVAVQLDGIPLSRTSMLELAQDDLSRVEFLLGPQGTLYGRNATAGVLNLITPTPPRDFEAGLTVGGGNYHQFEAKGYVGGPLNARVRARLYVGAEQHEGYIEDVTTGQRLDDQRDLNFRLAVDADVTDKFAVELRAFDLNGHSSGPVYKPIDPVNGLPPGSLLLQPWKIKADHNYGTTLKMAGGSVRLSYALTPSDKLTSLTGYIHYDDHQHYDADGTSLDLFYNDRPQHLDQATEEIDYIHEGSRLKAVLGGFVMYEKINDLGETVFTPGFVPINGLVSLGFANEKKNSNEAVFGDLTYAATDRLSVFGGLRGIFDHRALTVTDSLNFVGGVTFNLCTPADPTGNESSQTDALTGRFGARYAVNDTSSVFGSVSRGYKSGGFNPAACGNAYAPEYLSAFEIGSKNVFFDHRLIFNVAAFYYDFKNLQVEQVVGTSSVIDSVPRSHIYGLDSEVSWKLSSRWLIDGNLSLLHARYVNFFYIDQLTNINENLAGKPLNRSPDWSLNVGLQYTQPLPVGRVIARVDIYSTDKFVLRPSNQPADFQPSYTTLAASISYVSADEKLRLRAWVKNATDQAYLQGIFAIPLFGLGREGIYGPPATYGVELTRNF